MTTVLALLQPAAEAAPHLETILSVPIITVLTASALAIIGAVAAGGVSMITAWRTIASKVASIEGHVNSEKTASEGRERAKDTEIALLREMLHERKEAAALLAQAASARGRHPPEPAPTAEAQSLENIDAQTKAIEANTAR